MTDIAMNYVVNPLQGFWKGLQRFAEVAGYARAAAELSRLGYYKEAKACMMQVKKLRAE
jgi:hypothetical protein